MKKTKRPRKPARAKPATRDRYGAAVRLLELRKRLATPHGMTIAQVREAFDCSRQSAIRMISALEHAGEPLEQERDGPRHVYRLPLPTRGPALKPSTAHVLAITVARQVLDFLEGTTLKEGFDEIVEQLEASLSTKAFASLRDLPRKIHVVNDAPYVAFDRADVVDAVLTALEREERLSVTRAGGRRGEQSFDLEPYTLVVYKKGLYVHGYSHRHKQARTFSLDGFADVTWKRGDTFDYPRDFDPAAKFSGSFGIIDGPLTEVRIAFTARVAKWVTRRVWHASQRVTTREDGRTEVAFRVRGTTELVSWILSWGADAEVIEPESLRDELYATCEGMRGVYG
jgi:proteasome accessory factor B